MLAPALAPFLQQVGAVPVAVLLAESVLADLAHRQHHMRVRLRQPIGADVQWTLRSAIIPRSTNSRTTKSRASSMPCSLVISLGMANSISRASCASIRFSAASTSFHSFSRSERCSARHRQHHLGMDDACLVREIVMPVEPLIVQSRSRAIGRRRQRRRSRGARDDFGREVVDCHGGKTNTLNKRRWNNV